MESMEVRVLSEVPTILTMFFLVQVETEDNGTFTCVANSTSEYYAEKAARNYYREEGEIVAEVTAEMFNSFEHGDPRDYTMVN